MGEGAIDQRQPGFEAVDTPSNLISSARAWASHRTLLVIGDINGPQHRPWSQPTLVDEALQP
jgi:hypothetical protein